MNTFAVRDRRRVDINGWQQRPGASAAGKHVNVSRQQFCELLVSRRPLVRKDQPAAGLCGLMDPHTGTTFVISRNELYAA